MVTDTGIPKVGENSTLADNNIVNDDKLKLESAIDRSVYGMANLQQGLVGQGIPAGAIQQRPINGSLIIDGTIAAEKLVIGNGSFITDTVFSTPFYDQANWTSGTLYFKNGSTAAIDAGNTGRLGTTTTYYIYYSPETASVLQYTTNQLEVQGTAVLLCLMEPQASTATGAILTTTGAAGTTISGDNIKTGKIESSDGSTYFDLTNNKIVMNDGTNDRLFIGKV